MNKKTFVTPKLKLVVLDEDVLLNSVDPCTDSSGGDTPCSDTPCGDCSTYCSECTECGSDY